MGEEKTLMKMEATVTIKGAIFAGKGPEIIQSEVLAFMYEATAFLERKVKENIREAGRVGVGGAQGGLLSTIHGEVEKGTPVTKGVVAHQSKYGDVIEKGRTPGKTWPPEGALLKWMMLKMGLGETEAKRLEFVVRRKIGRKGFPGIHMFEKAWTRYLPQIIAMADTHGLKLAERLSE